MNKSLIRDMSHFWDLFTSQQKSVSWRWHIRIILIQISIPNSWLSQIQQARFFMCKKLGQQSLSPCRCQEYFLTFASCNLELAKGSDGRVSHAMRPLGKAQVRQPVVKLVVSFTWHSPGFLLSPIILDGTPRSFFPPVFCFFFQATD